MTLYIILSRFDSRDTLVVRVPNIDSSFTIVNLSGYASPSWSIRFATESLALRRSQPQIKCELLSVRVEETSSLEYLSSFHNRLNNMFYEFFHE